MVYMKFRGKLLITILLLFLMAAGQVNAAQLSPPLSESYGYDYPSPDPVNSWPEVYEANKYIDAMGYNGKAYFNSSAYGVRNTMGDDAVFFISGHAAPGYQKCWNGTSFSKLSASINNNDNSAYSLQAKFGGTTELRDIRLAVFLGCESGVWSSSYGRLPEMTRSLGVDVSMGWLDLISDAQTAYYAKRFFYYLNQSLNIRAAHDFALTDTKNAYNGDAGNLGKVTWWWHTDPSNLGLKPAGYGTN